MAVALFTLRGLYMKITILCVGKIKEKYFADAIAEYAKRLSRYCKLEIIEVADEKTPDHASEVEVRQIKAKEGERLQKYVKDDAFKIVLAIQGKRMTSEKFSSYMEQLGVYGVSHIIFFIGGSLGLDDNIIQSADFSLSFSDMTFPHQLMRVILLEQIYRGYRIQFGEPYHK